MYDFGNNWLSAFEIISCLSGLEQAGAEKVNFLNFRGISYQIGGLLLQYFYNLFFG